MATAHDWIWVPSYGMYFSPSANVYARPNPLTGEWDYQSVGESSTATGEVGSGTKTTSMEAQHQDGGIGNVGWGLLIDDDDLARVNGDRKNDLSEPSARGMIETEKRANGAASTVADPVDQEVKAYNDALNFAYDPASSASAGPKLVYHSHHSTAPPTVASQTILRLVALSSQILEPTEKVAILDSRPEGFEIGRDRAFKPRIRLKEMEVSKVHACIFWSGGKGGAEDDEGEEGFWVVDSGSTHGTFLLNPDQSKNPHRLSESRTSSKPYRLYHLSRIIVGSTTFECHIHPSWPCDSCALKDNNVIPSEELSQVEKDRLRAIRDAAMTGTGTIVSPVPLVPGDWKQTEERRVAMTAQAKRDDTDRRSRLAMQNLKASYFGEEEAKKNWRDGVGTKKRKEKDGPADNGWGGRPAQKRKTESSERIDLAQAISTPLSKENKGHSLLVKAGWAPGSSLGSSETGRLEAIAVHATDGRAGIGSTKMMDLAEVIKQGDESIDWKDKGKERRWEQAQRKGH